MVSHYHPQIDGQILLLDGEGTIYSNSLKDRTVILPNRMVIFPMVDPEQQYRMGPKIAFSGLLSVAACCGL